MQEKIIEALTQFNPHSVFLYGSRGRGDHNDNSDYEIGVIFKDNAFVERRVIHQAFQLDGVVVYPFKLSEIQAGILDTPFVESIYLRELVEGGKTIHGEKVVELLTPPTITTLDLIRSIRFEIGYALAAVLSSRTGDIVTSNGEFSKACLFGLRSLIILKLNRFVCSYDAMYDLRHEVITDSEYLEIVEVAYSLRKGVEDAENDVLFDNLVFLGYIEREILEAFKAHGNSELII